MVKEPFEGIESIRDPMDVLIAEAKKWLKGMVHKNTRYSGFQILKLNTTVDTVLKNGHHAKSFFFLCRFDWQLNSWMKHVETEIIVVYDVDMKMFVSTSDPVING